MGRACPAARRRGDFTWSPVMTEWGVEVMLELRCGYIDIKCSQRRRGQTLSRRADARCNTADTDICCRSGFYGGRDMEAESFGFCISCNPE